MDEVCRGAWVVNGEKSPPALTRPMKWQTRPAATGDYFVIKAQKIAGLMTLVKQGGGDA